MIEKHFASITKDIFARELAWVNVRPSEQFVFVQASGGANYCIRLNFILEANGFQLYFLKTFIILGLLPAIQSGETGNTREAFITF